MIVERVAEGTELWFVTRSQDLYGPELLRQVAEHSERIVEGLNEDGQLPVEIVVKPVATTAQAIRRLLADADTAVNCVRVIAWMHTFSPAQMWIPGLQALGKPLLHLHTQLNRQIPWDTIDMDFMNSTSRLTAVESSDSRRRGCVCRAKCWWVIGRIRRFTMSSGHGLQWRSRTTMQPTAGSLGSGTTCAVLRSQRATKSARERRSGTRWIDSA